MLSISNPPLSLQDEGNKGGRHSCVQASRSLDSASGNVSRRPRMFRSLALLYISILAFATSSGASSIDMDQVPQRARHSLNQERQIPHPYTTAVTASVTGYNNRLGSPRSAIRGLDRNDDDNDRHDKDPDEGNSSNVPTISPTASPSKKPTEAPTQPTVRKVTDSPTGRCVHDEGGGNFGDVKSLEPIVLTYMYEMEVDPTTNATLDEVLPSLELCMVKSLIPTLFPGCPIDDGSSNRLLQNNIFANLTQLEMMELSREIDSTIGMSTLPADQVSDAGCKVSNDSSVMCMPFIGKMTLFVEGTEYTHVKSQVFKLLEKGMVTNDFVNAHECIENILFVGFEDNPGSAPEKSSRNVPDVGIITMAIVACVAGAVAVLFFVKVSSNRMRSRQGGKGADVDSEVDDSNCSSFNEKDAAVFDRDLFNIMEDTASMPSESSSVPPTFDQETVIASNKAIHVDKVRMKRGLDANAFAAMHPDLDSVDIGAQPRGLRDSGTFDFFDLILESSSKARKKRETGTCSVSEISD